MGVPKSSSVLGLGVAVKAKKLRVATDLALRLQSGEKLRLIDVREPHEYQICRIPTARLIPLGDVPKRLNEIDRDAEIVLHCKGGESLIGATSSPSPAVPLFASTTLALK